MSKQVKEGTPVTEKRPTKMCGSINFNTLSHDDFNAIESVKEKIKTCFACSDNVAEWYVIYHSGTNTPHYHYILTLKRQTRVGTMINYIADFLGINPLAVNCKPCSSVSAQVRYITHHEEDIKVQFSIDDIESNMSREYIKLLYESDDDTFDFHRLVEIIFECGNEIQVMEKLGIALFHKYRYEIKIMLDNSSYVADYYRKTHVEQ